MKASIDDPHVATLASLIAQVRQEERQKAAAWVRGWAKFPQAAGDKYGEVWFLQCAAEVERGAWE